MPDNVPDPVPPTPPVPPPDPQGWGKWALRLIPNNWQKIVGGMATMLVAMGVNWVLTRQDKAPLPVPPIPEPTYEFGWIPPTDAERAEALALLETPYFADTEAGKAADSDENAFLWNYLMKARGRFTTRNQGRVGSCVSFGWACAIEHALAVQNVLKRAGPQEQVDVCQEVIYGGSRTEGRGTNRGPPGDGSTGAWMVKYVSTGGVLARGTYSGINLEAYNESRCREYGSSGVPAVLKPLAKKNLVTGFSLVRNGDEAKKAIQQGYPIPVCSNVGFTSVRDAEGFMPIGWKPWPHCMCLIGYQGGARPGFYCMNSWGGDWAKGPYGQYSPPIGGFWIDAHIVDRMMRQQDSYAISQVTGFPRQKLTPQDWTLAPRPNPLKIERMFANVDYRLAP